MALNIKNSEAHRLAAELARMRGVSVTKAVTDALREQIDRQRRSLSRKGVGAQLMEIGRRCAAHVTVPVSSGDHAALLYDNEGLPR